MILSASRARPTVAAVWLSVALLAIASQARLLDALSSPRYAVFRVAREYGLNLSRSIADLRRTDSGTLRVADGRVPRAALGFEALSIGTYSRFLPIFDPDIDVVRNGACVHTVRDDGTISGPIGKCTWVPLGSDSP